MVFKLTVPRKEADAFFCTKFLNYLSHLKKTLINSHTIVKNIIYIKIFSKLSIPYILETFKKNS